MTQHRKTVKHFHEPGDFHELTFSCYRQMKLLTNDEWRCELSRSIDKAMQRHSFQLVAFVFMPEHVHLLVYPTIEKPDIDLLLKAVKQPFSTKIKTRLKAANSPLLKKLTIRERPNKYCFRFWQEGPGYDRNLHREESVMFAIDYIHMNPVRRDLCEPITDWKWSSARHYVLPDEKVDADLPTIHGIPPGLFEPETPHSM